MSNSFEAVPKIQERVPLFEDIYGMTIEELDSLIKSRGYTEPVSASDPNFQEKYEKFSEKQKSFGVARVKLFDRVLSGEASEEEIRIACEHAAEKARIFGVDHRGSIPDIWYTNEKIADAIAQTSPENKRAVENILKEGREKLSRNYEAIDKDGFAREYYRG